MAGEAQHSGMRTARISPSIEVLESRIAPANVLTVNSSGSGIVVLDLTAKTITGPDISTPVSISGADVVNLAGTDAFTIKGTSGSDSLDYAPLGPTSGQVTVDGLNLVVNFTGITGSFTIDPLGGGDVVTVNCQPGNNAITATASVAPTVQVGAAKPVTLTAATVGSLVINGNTGNDQLTVDSTAGAFLIPITYNGGPGFDTLVMQGGTAISSHFTAGATPDAGVSTLLFANGTQTVSFTGLEPVTDNVVSASTTVNATNGNDAINYTAGPGGGAFTGKTGLISVNNQETYEFNNKTVLIINGLAGTDTINLNDSTTPTGLTSITVIGSDPSAGDTVIVNGVSTSTSITVSSLSANGATIAGAQPVPVNVNGAEYLSIVGAANNANLNITSPTGGSEIQFTPGATVDSGSITHYGFTLGTALLPIDFSSLGGGGSLTFSVASGGRTSSLEIHGGDPNEQFNVSASGQVQLVKSVAALESALTLPMTTTGVNTLALDGAGANDQFNLTGAVPFANTILNGGALANLMSASGSVTVKLADPVAETHTSISGYGGSVIIIGVDTVDLDANSQSATITGTSQNDTIIYTPTGAAAATFQNAGSSMVFNLSNATGNVKVFNDPGGNADQVVIRGTAARDLIEINQSSGVATVLANNVTALLPVQLGISVEILTAVGLGGENTFQVIPALGVASSSDNLLINIDGGADGENNALVLGSSFGSSPGNLAANQFVVVGKNSTDSGTIRVFASAVPDPDIYYQHIQVVSPLASGSSASPNLLVMGPDPFQGNETLANAAFLGASAALTVQNAEILPTHTDFPGAAPDQDFYSVIAAKTGFIEFQLGARTFSTSLAPGGGQLQIQAFDGAGNSMANPGAGVNQIVISAIAGQTYYLEVSGATAAAFNSYGLSVVNETANQAPTISAPSVAVMLVNNSSPISHVAVNDVDAGNGLEKVTLSAGTGVLSLGSLAGLAFLTGTGHMDHTMIFTGTIPEIDNALAGLAYEGLPDTSQADTVSITVTDQGNTGFGGAQSATATIQITPNFHTAQVLADPSKPGSSALVIDGSDPAGGGNDTIIVNPGPVKNSFQVIFDGVAQPLLTGVTGRILVFGQDNGKDTITIGKTIKNQTLLIGGAGDDTINGDAGINFISGGPGHNTLFGGAGHDNTLIESGDFNVTLKSGLGKANGSLIGGSIDDLLIKNSFKNAQLTAGPSGDVLDASLFTGNTVLVGGADDDILKGGSGFNVLIGGAGSDTLTGGKNRDLLIGGSTNFDSNIRALSLILKEWSSAASYTTKVAQLLGTQFGGKNGSILLNRATVIDDGQVNSLTGGAGLDWFFKGASDAVTDLNTGLKKLTEIVTPLS